MEFGLKGLFTLGALRRRRLAGWLVLCCAGFTPGISGDVTREYDVKAVLVLNFTQFVEWPARSFTGRDAPFVIGVLGRDPFGKVLEGVVQGERCGSRPIEVRRFRSVDEVHGCQILFVSESEKNDLPRIFAVLRGKPILTVGDFEGFALRGGMMRLLRNPAGKINLRVNLEAVKAADLSVSAKLLRVAEVIGGSTSD